MVGTIMKFTSPWVQCLMLSIFCLSGCCCGCCCCCCCCFNFCCGKCAPELKDMEDIPDVAEFEDEEDEDVVTEQPGTRPNRNLYRRNIYWRGEIILLHAKIKTRIFYSARNAGTGGANGTTQSSDGAKPTEKSPLKNDSKNKYAAGK